MSDWISCVGSSVLVVWIGLARQQAGLLEAVEAVGHGARGQQQGIDQCLRAEGVRRAGTIQRGQHVEFALVQAVLAEAGIDLAGGQGVQAEQAAEHGHAGDIQAGARTEENTSELPSLMRISYAVFCLKKNKKQ